MNDVHSPSKNPDYFFRADWKKKVALWQGKIPVNIDYFAFSREFGMNSRLNK